MSLTEGTKEEALAKKEEERLLGSFSKARTRRKSLNLGYGGAVKGQSWERGTNSVPTPKAPTITHPPASSTSNKPIPNWKLQKMQQEEERREQERQLKLEKDRKLQELIEKPPERDESSILNHKRNSSWELGIKAQKSDVKAESDDQPVVPRARSMSLSSRRASYSGPSPLKVPFVIPKGKNPAAAKNPGLKTSVAKAPPVVGTTNNPNPSVRVSEILGTKQSKLLKEEQELARLTKYLPPKVKEITEEDLKQRRKKQEELKAKEAQDKLKSDAGNNNQSSEEKKSTTSNLDGTQNNVVSDNIASVKESSENQKEKTTTSDTVSDIKKDETIKVEVTEDSKKQPVEESPQAHEQIKDETIKVEVTEDSKKQPVEESIEENKASSQYNQETVSGQ
eukprot:TRINITY_DN1531_c0_g1_i1.p1 TRINITY_DN1531_c0_g1~~TRINITY_DN1531_c0_g1_i1.p1  ORF type:complete len:394 (-),score=111.82 TRINITY_DN1531_c0_g1_i1:100-1281(-)